MIDYDQNEPSSYPPAGAFRAGRNAFLAGKSENDCPYPRSRYTGNQLPREWLFGYRNARLLAARKQHAE